MQEDEFKKVVVENVVECTDAIIKIFQQKLLYNKDVSGMVMSSVILNCANNIIAFWLDSLNGIEPEVADIIDKFEKGQLEIIQGLCQRKRKNLHLLN